MGLAYKQDIDDLRESPALYIARQLKAAGASLRVCEPNIENHPEFDLFAPQEAVDGADLVVFLVGHREFTAVDTGDTPVMDVCGARR
jgi:UDP-N-acetyl-D-mannosaminuronic acid dehydrogenase